MRADVPDGTQGAAFAGFDTPVVVRGKQQPILQIAAGDVKNVPDLAGPDHRARLEAERIEANVVVNRGDEIRMRLSCLRQLGCFRRGHCQRFLADDVLAGVEARQHLLVMIAVRRGDMDHVHIVVFQQLLQAGVAAGQAETCRRPLRFSAEEPRIARYANAEPAQRLDVDRTDEAGTDDGRRDLVKWSHAAQSISNTSANGMRA